MLVVGSGGGGGGGGGGMHDACVYLFCSFLFSITLSLYSCMTLL